MLLCLDVGNTHIMGGVFEENNLLLRFRCSTHLLGTSDQFGMFLINIMQYNKIPPESISATAVCSVVPSYDYTIKHTISHYFVGTPYFVLQAGVKTGLNIKYKNPKEVGADRIANAIGAMNAFPNKNIIIIDMGTATTLCAITKNRDYIGGSILPGLRVAMESLKSNTAKLMEVDIEIPSSYIGRTTRECIQSGLYYGQLGALKEIISGIKREVFNDEPFLVIGTGGFSQLYKEKSLLDIILPDLVLQGLCKAYEYFCQDQNSNYKGNSLLRQTSEQTAKT
jgi:type III pantothenate kinase